jgi:hypothetical protein
MMPPTPPVSEQGPGGAWKQLYSAASPEADKQYTKDVLDWTRRATQAIHGAGLLVIPNFSGDQLSPEGLQVGNFTDGILAEGGLASWNPVPGTKYAHKPGPKTTPAKFEDQLHWVRNLQRHGKGFYAINEWGAGPDYGLNPSKQPHNISGVANRPIRQFLVAAFMVRLLIVGWWHHRPPPSPRWLTVGKHIIYIDMLPMLLILMSTWRAQMMNGGTMGIYLTCIQCCEYAPPLPTTALARLCGASSSWLQRHPELWH